MEEYAWEEGVATQQVISLVGEEEAIPEVEEEDDDDWETEEEWVTDEEESAANRPEGNNDDTVEIKVKMVAVNGTFTFFKLKKNTRLGVLMEAYSAHQNMQMNHLRFLFRGLHHVSIPLLWLSF